VNKADLKQGADGHNNSKLDYAKTRKKISSFRGLIKKLQLNAESFRFYQSCTAQKTAVKTAVVPWYLRNVPTERTGKECDEPTRLFSQTVTVNAVLEEELFKPCEFLTGLPA